MEFLTQKITSLFDYDKEKIEPNPNLVWLVILISFSVLLILVLWFGVALFMRVENGSFFSVSGAPRRIPNTVIDKEKLAETTVLYENRRAEHEQKKTVREWVGDPSL